MSQPPTSFADKLTLLINTVHPVTRGPYDDEELGQAWGVSRQYVWQLRTGKRAEPRHTIAMKIVRFFGVPDDYFVDDDVTVTTLRHLQRLVDARDTERPDVLDVEVRRLALRILDLDADEREIVSAVVDELRAYNDLPRHQRLRRKPPRPDSR